jgi:hypothetical protein
MELEMHQVQFMQSLLGVKQRGRLFVFQFGMLWFAICYRVRQRLV